MKKNNFSLFLFLSFFFQKERVRSRVASAELWIERPKSPALEEVSPHLLLPDRLGSETDLKCKKSQAEGTQLQPCSQGGSPFEHNVPDPGKIILQGLGGARKTGLASFVFPQKAHSSPGNRMIAKTGMGFLGRRFALRTPPSLRYLPRQAVFLLFLPP